MDGDALAAVDRLEAALARGTNDATSRHELARAYRMVGRIDDAVNMLCRVAAGAPADPALREELTELTDEALRAGHIAAAEWAAECLTDLDPGDAGGWARLVDARRRAGDDSGLATAVRRWAQHCPADETAAELLRESMGPAAVGAPAGQVRALFDRYAPEFDEHLARLGYRAPAVVAERLATLAGGQPLRAVADLGCGTGQVGELVRPLTARLVGVDLSPGMLDVARGRGCYDQLVEGDLVAFVRAHPRAFDAIVSADTLNYLGDLQPVFAAVRAALNRDGALVFTLERGDGVGALGYRLEASGRYQHDAAHVERLLAATSFTDARLESCVLRREGNLDVVGLVVSAVAR